MDRSAQEIIDEIKADAQGRFPGSKAQQDAWRCALLQAELILACHILEAYRERAERINVLIAE